MTQSFQHLQAQLQSLSRQDILPHWRQSRESPLTSQPESGWQRVQLNDRGHIPWSRGNQELWLSQTLVIPDSCQGISLADYRLYLSLRWWADLAEFYVNGERHHSGDLFDCFGRILLQDCLQPGQEIHLSLYLVSPNHDEGALVTSELLYERDDPDPGFIADELAVCAKFYPQLRDNPLPETLQLDFSQLPQQPNLFLAELQRLQTYLAQHYPSPPGTLYLMGHAHLDMAWLWPLADTWTAAQCTFESVLNLQNQFPELIFSHSSAALYDWIEQHRPDLFAQIQTQVKRGVWEVAAGLWVEPELNLISGESIVRQLLYGQGYVQKKFQQTVRVAWLPDSFGFCWQLPQLLKQGGIDYFVTQKLRWNDTTTFPHQLFWWESPEGSRVLSLMSAPIGQGIDPEAMADYWADWRENTGVEEGLWLPGVGDHGGGPTRDMLEVARRWQGSALFPRLAFSSATDYLDRLQGQVDRSCPVWRDELYLEFHRGCYTTEGDRKLANRQGERLLYEAELFASLASYSSGVPYPQDSLETAWKGLLLNQFHDILPGSTIPQVLEEANHLSAAGLATATQIRDEAIATLLQQLPPSPPPYPEAIPVYVVNSLTWGRSHLVSLPRPDEQSWRVCDDAGTPILSQQRQSQLQFQAKEVPGVGVRRYWIYPEELPPYYSTASSRLTPPPLENAFLRVTIDGETGNIQEIFDKVRQQQVLNSLGGNCLQAYEDKGQYWDAWNIDPNYEQHPLPAAELETWELLEFGELQQRVRVIRRLGDSRIGQDYILEQESPLLRIETDIDWQETQTLLKVAFHLNLESDVATYEIPCGAIARPTQPQTPAEAAKWEVPALQWADISNSEFGVSLLQDCKHGYDAKANQLRLTLLRSSQWPNPQSDRGQHHITYAIYPHGGDWKSGQTVRRAYELNQPLLVYTDINDRGDDRPSPSCHQWLSLNSENLILMALKQSETDKNDWILRVYDSLGESSQLEIEGLFNQMGLTRANLLEQDAPGERAIAPWQIASFRLTSSD
ncbi:alpha-mannosidase [Sodalinema gerasimenkoae]|uniref:alpha-mannosidase n=1 Tax=Sodalinema gerasimenkoae TaxID=2862348 RepID=UPI00135A8A33|nr:alpha-mannosidase [Sodalinema gerasimenkoae]